MYDPDKAINELYEENETLKRENDKLQHVVDYIWQEIYKADEPVLSVSSVEKLRSIALLTVEVEAVRSVMLDLQQENVTLKWENGRLRDRFELIRETVNTPDGKMTVFELFTQLDRACNDTLLENKATATEIRDAIGVTDEDVEIVRRIHADILETNPERIYLQEDTDGETTWCSDQINDDDCEYIRADKYVALKQENEELRKFRDFVDILVKTLPRDFVDTLLTVEKPECEHPNAVSAINKVIQNGMYCPDCNTVFAEDKVHDA